MRTAADRAKDRREFRLEWLEDRNLLSVMKASAIAAEVRTAGEAPAPPAVPVLRGHVVGLRASDGLFGGTLPGFTSYSGHGRANVVGNVYLGTQQLETLGSTTLGTRPLSINDGTAELTTFRGDRVQILYVGQGQVTRQGRTTIRLQGIVVSGTGAFDGVTGSFQGAGSVNHSGRFTLDFVISLNYPTSSRPAAIGSVA